MSTSAFYLTVVQGAQGSLNTPLELASQAAAGTAVLPSAQAQGFGGLDLMQLAAATSTQNYGSPIIRLCAQQYITSLSSTEFDCWLGQANGGAGPDPSPTFEWSRATNNGNTNITMIWPNAINLSSHGQMTVGGIPLTSGSAAVGHVTTLTGQSYEVSGGTGFGTDVIVQPGLVIDGTLESPGEGQLVLSQGYLAGSDVTPGKLGCLSAAQTLSACTSTGSAENWLGVIESYTQFGESVLAERAGRYSVRSNANATWSHGDYVCKDDSNAGYSIDNGASPCLDGESVGVAVNDEASATKSHVVDLLTGPSVATPTNNTMLTFFCIGTATQGATLYMFPSASVTTCTSTSATAILPVSFGGTLKNLQVFYATPPGTSHTDTFTVVKCPGLASCSPTTITCQISGATTPSTCSDLAHSVSISQGDGVQIKDVTDAASGAQNARITIQIQ